MRSSSDSNLSSEVWFWCSENCIPPSSTFPSSSGLVTVTVGEDHLQSSCALLHQTGAFPTDLVSWVLPPASGCSRLHPLALRSSTGSLLWWGGVDQPQPLLLQPCAPPEQTPPLLCSTGDLDRNTQFKLCNYLLLLSVCDLPSDPKSSVFWWDCRRSYIICF